MNSAATALRAPNVKKKDLNSSSPTTHIAASNVDYTSDDSDRLTHETTADSVDSTPLASGANLDVHTTVHSAIRPRSRSTVSREEKRALKLALTRPAFKGLPRELRTTHHGPTQL